MYQAAVWICTSLLPDSTGFANDRTSIGHTVTQIPHPMHELFWLVISSCLRANRMTSMPTWQFREHSSQAMHLFVDWMENWLTLNRAKTALNNSIIFANGHQ